MKAFRAVNVQGGKDDKREVGCVKTGIKCTAVMLAAGVGLRMGRDIRKQYIMLGRLPMFLHSIRTMEKSPYITDIIVMAHRDDLQTVRRLLEEYGYTRKLRRIAAGGKERVHSVANGLEAIDWPCDYVFIHDCARPFLDQETIYRLYDTVQKTGACVAGVPSKDTVKIVDNECNVASTPNRAGVWIVQTPQVFSFELIRDAHRKALANEDYLKSRGIILTDDAMVAEYASDCRVRMVMSTYRNIKITTPEDLIIGEAFLREKDGCL